MFLVISEFKPFFVSVFSLNFFLMQSLTKFMCFMCLMYARKYIDIVDFELLRLRGPMTLNLQAEQCLN